MIEKSTPGSWTITKLGSVCKLRNGFAFKSDNYIKEGIPVIRISDIGEGKVDLKSCVKVKLESQYIDYKLSKGDILVAMSGATTGKFGIFQSEHLAFQNQRVGRFEILNKSSLNNDFLLYLLYGLKHKILEDAYGGAQPNISSSKIEEMEIPLPPLPEQQRIVAKIEELFSELDKGIETLKTAQQQLKVYRQAVLKYAFEGKLTNSNVKEGELPEGWESKNISDVAKINPSLPNKEAIDRNLVVQFLPMKLVEEITNKIHLTETRKYADVLKGSYTPFIDNDIIFAKVTPCMENGKIAIVNNLMNGVGFGSSEFHVLRCNDQILNSYLHRFIVQDKFRNEAQKAMTGAVGLRRVPKQFIENYLIPVPNTLEQQSKIIQEIESRLSVCDNIEESIVQGLQQAEALRQSILKKAFEGKLVPQDPNDEPASVLLYRIKAERIAAQPEKKSRSKKVK